MTGPCAACGRVLRVREGRVVRHSNRHTVPGMVRPTIVRLCVGSHQPPREES